MIRIPTGIIAIILLLGGVYIIWFQPDVEPVVSGMMIRVGALMGVIWLAFPQLEKFKGRIPAIMIGLGIVCLAVAAARPNLGKVVIAIATVAVSVGGVLKWMSKMADSNQPRKK